MSGLTIPGGIQSSSHLSNLLFHIIIFTPNSGFQGVYLQQAKATDVETYKI